MTAIAPKLPFWTQCKFAFWDAQPEWLQIRRNKRRFWQTIDEVVTTKTPDGAVRGLVRLAAYAELNRRMGDHELMHRLDPMYGVKNRMPWE